MRDAVIVDALRTPVGRYAGVLSPLRPDDLAARTIEAVVERNELDPASASGGGRFPWANGQEKRPAHDLQCCSSGAASAT
jgi:acetyl-CoA acetyltransferase